VNEDISVCIKGTGPICIHMVGAGDWRCQDSQASAFQFSSIWIDMPLYLNQKTIKWPTYVSD
jgi:hypothetical protein